MCIICVKPAGVKLPDIDTIEEMWYSNPDGAGYMIANGKNVLVRKGFMKLEPFETSLYSHGDLTDKSVVMHFRIATHGGTNAECCHPFPLTDDLHSLHKGKSKVKFAVAHNGVISGMETSAEQKISDTIAYIMDVLAPLSELCDLTTDPRAERIISSTVGSKLAIMRYDGYVAMFGDFIEDGGCFYSNKTYIPYAKVWQNSSWGKPYGYNKWWEDYSYDYTHDYDYDSFDNDRYGCGEQSNELPFTDFDYNYTEFDACAGCDMRFECAELGAYCTNEFEAEAVVEEQGFDYDDGSGYIEPSAA